MLWSPPSIPGSQACGPSYDMWAPRQRPFRSSLCWQPGLIASCREQNNWQAEAGVSVLNTITESMGWTWKSLVVLALLNNFLPSSPGYPQTCNASVRASWILRLHIGATIPIRARTLKDWPQAAHSYHIHIPILKSESAKLGISVHDWNPSTWQTEIGGLAKSGGQTGPHCETDWETTTNQQVNKTQMS